LTVSRAHLASSSRSTYGTGVRDYARVALYFRPGQRVFPPSDANLAAYAAFKGRFVKVATLKVYLAAVRNHCVEQGLPYLPHGERPQLAMALKGVKRLRKDDCAKPKLAITLDIIRRLCEATVGPTETRAADDGNARTFMAAVLVGFFGLLRKDNLTTGKPDPFNPDKGLLRSDLAFTTTEDGREMAVLRLRSSKTNQMGGAPHMVPLYPTGGVLCPVRALRWHTRRVIATESQPLFMWLNARKAPTPMTHRILLSSPFGVGAFCLLATPVQHLASLGWRFAFGVCGPTCGSPSLLPA